MPLTDTAIKNAKPGSKVRKLGDGQGMSLWVMPDGKRYWRLAYRFAGKQKLLALGVYRRHPTRRSAGAAGTGCLSSPSIFRIAG